MNLRNRALSPLRWRPPYVFSLQEKIETFIRRLNIYRLRKKMIHSHVKTEVFIQWCSVWRVLQPADPSLLASWPAPRC